MKLVTYYSQDYAGIIGAGLQGRGWQGGQGLDLKMEADHDWSPETRLQGCAGSG